MEFKDIVKSRYSVKKFDGRMIPEPLVEELFEMIRLSASSVNSQPWKIKIIKDQETKNKLFDPSRNQQQIITCSHLLVFCVDTNFEDRKNKIISLMKEQKIPEENVVAYTKMAEGFLARLNDKEKLEWAKNQVHIALGNALNGAKSLGFDSCPIGGFSPEEYSKILNLPAHLIPVVLCPIGYASKDLPVRTKVRLSKEDVFF